MYKLLLGTAMALSMTGAALADPGGNGRGNERGPSQSQADRSKPERSANRAHRGQPDWSSQAAQASQGHAQAAARADKQHDKADSRASRNNAAPATPAHPSQHLPLNQREIAVNARDLMRGGDNGAGRRMARNLATGLVDGCPPGLAKKNDGCLPPGQARQNGARPYDDPRYFGYAATGRFLLGNGYLYRLGDGDRVTGFIPLLAGALGIGDVWPSQYARQPLPEYYRDYFNVGPDEGHAYADNVIYRLDPQTAAIQSVAAILTGDRFVTGQPMPAGYDVYNIPAPYQSRYADTQDAAYRYADGRIYQIDPETQVIAAIIELLT